MKQTFIETDVEQWLELKQLPGTYIVCTEERTISPSWSRYAARHRLGVASIELPGGHWPHLSRPAHLADVLIKEQV